MTKENQAKRRRVRTENYGISFDKNGYAVGWRFDVGEHFRDVMDIKYIEYVDREKTNELRERAAKEKNNSGKSVTVKRMAWTRGVPPVRRFERGHVFYEPHGPRKMIWGDALKILRTSIQVDEALPDNEGGKGGWVKFTIRTYKNGEVFGEETKKLSQEDFETFLQFGEIG